LLALRGLILHPVADAWDAMDFVFGFAFGAYLLSASIRSMRWASAQGTAGSATVKWGRVFFGAFLIFIETKNLFHPAANLLRPSNETQAMAMNATAIALVLLGAWLIVSGVISRFKRQLSGNESSKIVP
jgi:hypothetical protein